MGKTLLTASEVNLPCDGLSLILIFFFLKVHNPRTPLLEGLKATDWLGALIVTGGTVMFSLGLEFGGVTYPWSSATVSCLISHGVSTFLIFLLFQWKIAKHPIMPLRLFNHRSNAAVFIVVIAQGMAFISTAYFLPFYFQAVLGATPIQSGLWVLLLCGAQALTSIATGAYIQKGGNYCGVIWFGAFFMTLGFGLFIDLQPYHSWTRITVYQVLVSLGIGPLFQPPIIALQAHLGEKDVATGTSTISFLRMLSAGVSVVVGQVIFQSQIQKPASYAAMQRAGISNIDTDTLAGGSTVSATFLIQTLTPEQQVVVRGVITSSLQKLWIFYAAISFVGLLASLGVQKMVLSTEHVDARTGLETGTSSPMGFEKNEMGGSTKHLEHVFH
jgi:hypothetical protein